MASLGGLRQQAGRICRALRQPRRASRRLLRRLRQRRGQALTGGATAAETDAYNAAAERHWASMCADVHARAALLRKPFASLREAPATLYRLGLALDALDLGAGDVVLDFGAGSCWLSLVLNRLGCPTVAVDVSSSALALGAEAFRRDPDVRAELEPRFVPYDGWTLPLESGSVDRAICFDSFHHVPNPARVLQELFRVLRQGGRLVLAEPGAGHSRSEASSFESEHYGVLEGELSLSRLTADARRAGFDGFEVKPYPEVDSLTLDAARQIRLLAGDERAFPLRHAVEGVRALHLVTMLKGCRAKDSRGPGELRARIEVGGSRRLEGHVGKEAVIPVSVTNLGDTLWLAAVDRACGGYVSLGGHLRAEGSNGVDRVGYVTHALPCDVPPGRTVRVAMRIPMPRPPGGYRLRLDLVDDRVAWFSQLGSPTTDISLVSAWADTRDPHQLAARIEPLGPFPPRRAADSFDLWLRVTNTGDTTWLGGADTSPGVVRVGVQRRAVDGAVVELDYFRLPLPGRVRPGEIVELTGSVPLRTGAEGLFAVDLVAEQIAWFAAHGSPVLSFALRE